MSHFKRRSSSSLHFIPLRLGMSHLEIFIYLCFCNVCLRSIRKAISLIREAPSMVYVTSRWNQTLQNWNSFSFVVSRVSLTFVQLIRNPLLDFVDILIFLLYKIVKPGRKFFFEYSFEFELTGLFNKFIANYARNFTGLIQGDDRVAFVLYFVW